MKISKLLKKRKKKALLPPSSIPNLSSSLKNKSQDPRQTSSSPPSSPSRKNVSFVVSSSSSGQPLLLFEDDDISAVTPATALPESPNSTNFISSKKLLLASGTTGISSDDDSCSHDFMVFEDKADDDNSSSSPSEKLKVLRLFSDDAMMAAGGKNIMSNQFDEYYEISKNNNRQTKGAAATTTTTTTTTTSVTSKSYVVKDLVKRSASLLTKTTYFTNAVNSAFDKVDVDKSGDVTLEELYAGLLLIHLKMAIYVGAPACRPASKKYVTEVFHIVDADNSGHLDRKEFGTAMQILYGQVFTRIVIQWTLTLILVPITTKHVIKYTTLFFHAMHEFWKDIDDDLDPVQRLLWKLWESWLYYSPEALDQVGAICWLVFNKIPWMSMPPIMLTVAQTSVALPWVLTHVEDFFRRAAHSLVSGEDKVS